MIARRAPLLVRPATRVRYLRADVRYAVGMAWVDFSEWIRPFDECADRWRWRWTRPACGRVSWAALPTDVQAALMTAVERHREAKDLGRGGAT